MRNVIDHDRCVLLHGDSADICTMVDDSSVDAVVTDPPSGISFMGKDWDDDKGGRDAWIAWLRGILEQAWRVLKPGGHALIWALPRTSHWTATAAEDAGFEIRDVHHHIFGTGFPKSLTSKSAPIPEGSGTAVKPAVEHWILARKPLEGTVGANFAAHGTGVLNIDACRIGTEGETIAASTHAASDSIGTFKTGERTVEPHAAGRWPAHLSLEHAETCRHVGQRNDSHVVRVGEKLGADSRELAFGMGVQATTTTTTTHDVYECVLGCPVRLLDEQSGSTKAHQARQTKHKGTENGSMSGRNTARAVLLPADVGGGASRFFYIAKGSRSEKDAGLEHLEPKTGGEATGRTEGSAGRTGGARNRHPTVKSVDLMRWLVRLITPPGGVVLDLFAGSGTTGVAALAEGCSFIGVERGDEYIPIIEGRLRHALKKIA